MGSERSAKLLKKWLRQKLREIQQIFCAINHGRCKDHANFDHNANDIIKSSMGKVKRC